MQCIHQVQESVAITTAGPGVMSLSPTDSRECLSISHEQAIAYDLLKLSKQPSLCVSCHDGCFRFEAGRRSQTSKIIMPASIATMKMIDFGFPIVSDTSAGPGQ